MLKAKDQFLTEIFECGILDLQFFFNLLEKIEENNLYFDTTSIIEEYGGMKLNIFISEALYLLVEGFLKKYKYKIENILNIGDFERYREENEIYEIHAEGVGSSISFFNSKIDSLFADSEYFYL